MKEENSKLKLKAKESEEEKKEEEAERENKESSTKYPKCEDIIALMNARKNWKALKDDDEFDLDEFVYDCISDWDKYFEDYNDWFNEEEGNDMKDRLRDEVLEYIEEEEEEGES